MNPAEPQTPQPSQQPEDADAINRRLELLWEQALAMQALSSDIFREARELMGDQLGPDTPVHPETKSDQG